MTTSPDVVASTAPGPPGDDVRCPLCDYDLRGLAEERCPECGYRFVWADISDPTRRLHRYLFEHHPERNVWSFVRTLGGGLRPRRFWTSLHPAQPSRPVRLLLYWLAGLALLAAVVAGHYALWFVQSASRAQAQRAVVVQSWGPEERHQLNREFGTFENFLDTFHPLPPSREFYRKAWEEEGQFTYHFAAFWLVWPWAVVLVLVLLFRFSMRRARVRRVHVLRCALYSFDAVVWLAVVGAAALGLRALDWYGVAPPVLMRLVPAAPFDTSDPIAYRPDVFTDTLFWGGLLVVALTTYRLTMAVRHYLRFDHAAATVLSAELIAGMLLVLFVLDVWPGLRNLVW